MLASYFNPGDCQSTAHTMLPTHNTARSADTTTPPHSVALPIRGRVFIFAVYLFSPPNT